MNFYKARQSCFSYRHHLHHSTLLPLRLFLLRVYILDSEKLPPREPIFCDDKLQISFIWPYLSTMVN